MENQSTTVTSNPDEINLLEYIYVLVKHKWVIICVTLLGLVGGFVAAKIKGPSWTAEAIIAPKESESKNGPNLGGLGALGGLVAGQLNLGGNASLDKIELILSSREFNSEFIKTQKLLPELYKYAWPKKYKKFYDSTNKKWNDSFIEPKPLEMGSFLKGKFIKKLAEKNGTMTITVKSKDSAFTLNLATQYIAYLNDYIRSNVQSDAKENVTYLEGQLQTIADPLLREKLQGLIANEIEKAMVVSKEAFRVVDPVFLAKTYKEKKLYPLVFGAGLFFIICLLVVLLHAFSSADKTEEDKQLIAKIKGEIPFLGKNR